MNSESARSNPLTNSPAGRDAESVQNEDLDHFDGQDLKKIYEFALLELGGQELLDDATTIARRSVDTQRPWSGLEPEPEERVAAYVEILWERINRARGRG